MEKRTSNYNEDPLPASNSIFAIEMLDRESQETGEGAGERGDARYWRSGPAWNGACGKQKGAQG